MVFVVHSTGGIIVKEVGGILESARARHLSDSKLTLAGDDRCSVSRPPSATPTTKISSPP